MNKSQVYDDYIRLAALVIRINFSIFARGIQPKGGYRSEILWL